MKNRAVLIAAIFVFCSGMTGLTARSTSAQAPTKSTLQPKFSTFLRTELFFGMDKPTGGQVTAEEWEKFLADVVTPRFPDGLTVDDAQGQYLDGKVLIREKSKQLILIYPRKFKTSSGKKIEEIRTAYRRAFDQKSVLRVDLPHAVLVSF